MRIVITDEEILNTPNDMELGELIRRKYNEALENIKRDKALFDRMHKKVVDSEKE